MIKYLKRNPRITEILFHVLFWAIHFVYRLYLTGYYDDYDPHELYTQLILLPVRMGITYFLIYFVIYRYLFKKKFGRFAFWLIVSIVGGVLLRRAVVFGIIFPYGIYENYENVLFWDFGNIAHSSIYIFPVVTVATIIIMVREWFKKEKLRLETTKEKLEAELKYLKAQINPHFLFNTINNIYALALEQSKKTPKALLKLSDMLNYMLYDSNTDRISLTKEIRNLHDYIELEQLRYSDKLDLVFNHNAKSSNVTIPPLLLLPFVENAFKHGASESIDKSWIHINLNEENQQLTFKVENSIDEKTNDDNNNEGIGLQNVMKRLDLLFHDKYELKTLKSSESFLVRLKLDLGNGAE